MAPLAGDGGALIVTFLVEALLKELVRKHAGLWNSIDAAPNFKVYPAVACVGEEVVLLDKFFGDVA